MHVLYCLLTFMQLLFSVYSLHVLCHLRVLVGGTRYRPNESGKEEGLPTLGGGSGFTSDPITGT